MVTKAEAFTVKQLHDRYSANIDAIGASMIKIGKARLRFAQVDMDRQFAEAIAREGIEGKNEAERNASLIVTLHNSESWKQTINELDVLREEIYMLEAQIETQRQTMRLLRLTLAGMLPANIMEYTA